MARQPFFNAPAAVVWTIAVLVAVHVMLWLLPEDLARYVVIELAFIPIRYTMLGEDALEAGAAVWTFITHVLVHGDISHLVFNSFGLLIFGGAVAMRIGTARYLALFGLSAVAGALAFLITRWGDPVPMVGASGAISGLMGGSFRFMFPALDRGGFQMFRERPRSIPLASIQEALADRRVQISIAALVVLNLFMAVSASTFTSADGIAWQAHLGGFLFGFLAIGLFEPPQRPRLQIVRPTLH